MIKFVCLLSGGLDSTTTTPKGTLNISEQFYSLQGEGPSSGTPAVFLRLQGCNLLCKWPCDTVGIWKNGKPWRFEEIISNWKKQGWYDKLRSQQAHLVITGGEPVLQATNLIPFVMYLKKEGLFIEIETNATLLVPTLYDLIDQINASPKLATSGIPLNRRYNPEAISYLAKSKNAWFKFVVGGFKDIGEIHQTYLETHNISPLRVILMPEAKSRNELLKKEEEVINLCKQYGFRYSTRLQIQVWDKLVGV